MVWSTAQSALYKAVDDYNSCNFGEKKSSKKYCENTPKKCTENPCKDRSDFAKKSSRNSCDNSKLNLRENCHNNSPNFDKKSIDNCRKIHRNFEENLCEKNDKKHEKASSFDAKIDCKRLQNGDFFGVSALFSDRDFVLLAGLIIILMNENVDKKLIFALIFVMLG